MIGIKFSTTFIGYGQSLYIKLTEYTTVLQRHLASYDALSATPVNVRGPNVS